jgi:hypothetical protein
MRPRPARLGNHRIQLCQHLIHQLQPAQHRVGQLGMVGIEGSRRRLRQVRDLAPHLAFG